MALSDTVAPTVLTGRWEDHIDQRPIAVVLLGLWGINVNVGFGVSTATAIVLLSIPLWLTAVGRYRFARPLLALGSLAIVAGVFMSVLYSNRREVNVTLGLSQAMVVVGILGGIGLILWARTLLSPGILAVVLGAAILAGDFQQVAGSSNPWKYYVSAPIAVIVLGALWRSSFVVQAAAALGLAAVGLVFDSRSYAAICVGAAVLVVIQHVPLRPARGWRGPTAVFLAAVVGGVVFYGVSSQLALNGNLGAEVAARTQDQVARAGSLLVGGRPEWSGTLGLMQEQPAGFGFGAVPTYEDVWAARAGLNSVGIKTSNGYVDNYMFGGQFKLHSVTADLWSQAGVLGLCFAVMSGVAVFLCLVDRWRTVALPAVIGFLAVKALWDLSFSPIYSSAAWIAVALGMVLVERSARRDASSATLTAAAQTSRPPSVQL